MSFLKLLVREEEQNSHKPEPLHQSELKKCKFLMNQALDADETGLKDIAIKLYTDAAELGLSAVSIRLLHNFYCIFVLPAIINNSYNTFIFVNTFEMMLVLRD